MKSSTTSTIVSLTLMVVVSGFGFGFEFGPSSTVLPLSRHGPTLFPATAVTPNVIPRPGYLTPTTSARPNTRRQRWYNKPTHPEPPPSTSTTLQSSPTNEPIPSISPQSITNGFQRVLLSTVALPFLSHGEELPLPARRLVSPRARIVLAFFVEYLASLRSPDVDLDLHVDLYASGGYVRDLLLGRISPDLDLSFGLTRCPPSATVSSILAGAERFRVARPDLAVAKVEVTTAVGERAVDAVQVMLELVGGDVIAVDVLPTIGREVYGGDHRVPDRDERGSAEEDSLRRDLTIGSMLLTVTATDVEDAGETGGTQREDTVGQDDEPTSVMSSAVRNASSNLRLVLLDYHDGIEDLSTRTLRCPTPNDATLVDVWNQVIVSPSEIERAASIGLTRPSDDACGDNDAKIRALWWAKTLGDDPYRLLRTLRFSVTLGFRIDPTFWVAAPFALETFDTKVSHTRKVDELRKVSQMSGVPGLMQFLDAIARPWVVGGSGLRDAFFGTEGRDAPGIVDWTRAQRLTARLPAGLSVDGKVGVALVIAVYGGETKDETTDASPNIDDDAFTRTAAHITRTHTLVSTACDGLCVPNSIRRGAIDPLVAARRLLEPLPILKTHAILARAVPWPSLPSVPISMEYRARQFAAMVRMWDVLRLAPRSDRGETSDPLWILGLVSAAAADCGGGEAARRLEADLLLLSSSCEDGGGGMGRWRRRGAPVVVGPQPEDGKGIGGAVAGLREVPPHLRGWVMAVVHVLTRLRGDAPVLETSDQLRVYLEEECGGVLTELAEEWWVDGGGGVEDGDRGFVGLELRSPYTKQ